MSVWCHKDIARAVWSSFPVRVGCHWRYMQTSYNKLADQIWKLLKQNISANVNDALFTTDFYVLESCKKPAGNRKPVVIPYPWFKTMNRKTAGKRKPRCMTLRYREGRWAQGLCWDLKTSGAQSEDSKTEYIPVKQIIGGSGPKWNGDYWLSRRTHLGVHWFTQYIQ